MVLVAGRGGCRGAVPSTVQTLTHPLPDAGTCLRPPQPPNVQAVVDDAIRAPLTDLAGRLQGFSWVYDKVRQADRQLGGRRRAAQSARSWLWATPLLHACAARGLQGDLHHWIPLLNHFDSILEELIKAHPELSTPGAAGAAARPPFPVDLCVAVLRTTALILENCSNKHLYLSYEVRGVGAPAPEAFRNPAARWVSVRQWSVWLRALGGCMFPAP